MRLILTIMAALFCTAAAGQTPGPASDIVKTADGNDLKINFQGHGSVSFEYAGRHIYIDPVSDYADYSRLPKADLILVTHEHGDHLDAGAVETLYQDGLVGYGNRTAVDSFGAGEVLEHGQKRDLGYVTVEAVPAYNTSAEKQNFHPKARLHNGYILTFGGTRVWVAGDTEDTPEALALRNIDIAFLPVNLPYTMTEEQAARIVKAVRPGIFYPYHYGGTDHKTDLAKLQKLIEGSGAEMRVRPLE